jgi:ABC-type sugar transport system ATPase subunit
MIEIDGLSFAAGGFRATDLSLSIPQGTYFVLLGPTGAGKTLLLKCLCGLVRAGAGSIRMDGRNITHLQPRLRGIGYVPQEAGLFPHLDVKGNIAFSMRVRGMSMSRSLSQLREVIDTLALQDLLDRRVAGLSGGERQKVAVARALACGCKLLLLDEPASSLDTPTRQHLCAELVRVQRTFGVVAIHVCHNLEEALSVGDQAGVLVAGRLAQSGTMEQLLAHPRNQTVARLLGGENFLTGVAHRAGSGKSIVALANERIEIEGQFAGPVEFTIRPEALQVQPTLRAGTNQLHATLLRVLNRGAYHRLELDAAGVPLVAYVAASQSAAMSPGQACMVELPAGAVHVFDKAT